MSPSVTETVKFFLRAPAKSAHGDFHPLKSQRFQSFITILLSISKCYRDSKVFFLRVSAKSAHGDFLPLKSQRFQSFNTIWLSVSECLCKVYSMGTAKRYEISMFQYNSLSTLSRSDSEITILKVCSRVPIQSLLQMAPNYHPFLLPGMRQYRVPLGSCLGM